MQEIIVHLGFPKAASTSLQRSVFAESDQIDYLGLYSTDNVAELKRDPIAPVESNIVWLADERLKEFYQLLLQARAAEFNQEEALGRWQGLLETYATDEKPVLLSHEAFLSVRFSNPSITEKLAHLRGVVGHEGVRLLVMIRAQGKLLESLYRDHPFDPVTLETRRDPVTYDEWLRIDMGNTGNSHMSSLHYEALLDDLAAWVGQDQVLMLPIELARFEPEAFVARLAGFLGIAPDVIEQGLIQAPPENSGITATANRYRRLRARLMPLVQGLPLRQLLRPFDAFLENWLKGVGRAETVRPDSDNAEMLRQRYGAENARLASRLGVDLASLGYPIAAEDEEKVEKQEAPAS